MKYDHLKEQVHGMQKLINSLFLPNIKSTPSHLSFTAPTVMQTADSDKIILSSQSSQATSLVVEGPSSGENVSLLSNGTTSDTISLSGGVTSDDGLVSADEGRQSVASSNVLVPSCISVPPIGANVEVSLLPPTELMQLYQKSCSRMNFAAKLSEKLFDQETRITHNVSGRGKPKLDPEVVAFIRAQCFEFFPCKSNERMEIEWSHCIVAIDEKSRRLKKKVNKKVSN